MPQAAYTLETAALRRILAKPDCRFRWTTHALERMSERGIHPEDVKRALMNGQIIFHEVKEDILYRVDGKDLDGARLQVQIAIFEDIVTIKVITAF